MSEASSTFRARARSVGHALRGVAVMLRSQPNARIHLVVTLLVVAAGLIFHIRVSEWLWIVLAVVAVWTAEALNTALELLADVSTSGYHPLVKQAKDVAAGAVLIVAVGAAVVGLLVFGPYLLRSLF